MRSVLLCILFVLFLGTYFPARVAGSIIGHRSNGLDQVVDPLKTGGPRKPAAKKAPDVSPVDPNKPGGPRGKAERPAKAAAAKKSANAGGAAASNSGGGMKSSGKKHHLKHRHHSKKS